jgi:hypothetical protein
MAVVAGAIMSSCGSSNVAKTPEQKAAANRGQRHCGTQRQSPAGTAIRRAN